MKMSELSHTAVLCNKRQRELAGTFYKTQSSIRRNCPTHEGGKNETIVFDYLDPCNINPRRMRRGSHTNRK
jgi:hypothetical protein